MKLKNKKIFISKNKYKLYILKKNFILINNIKKKNFILIHNINKNTLNYYNLFFWFKKNNLFNIFNL